MDVQCCACVGGTSIREDVEKLENGQHVVSGTHGRILDLIKRRQRKWQTQNIKLLILDEADNLLDEGNKDTIAEIYQHLPLTTQVVLLSATIADEVLEMTKALTDPLSILVKPSTMIPEGIKQFFKAGRTKFSFICDLYSVLPTGTQVVIFCNFRRTVRFPYHQSRVVYITQLNALTTRMRTSNFTVSSVHGDMEQKERDAVMTEFRNGTTYVEGNVNYPIFS